MNDVNTYKTLDLDSLMKSFNDFAEGMDNQKAPPPFLYLTPFQSILLELCEVIGCGVHINYSRKDSFLLLSRPKHSINKVRYYTDDRQFKFHIYSGTKLISVSDRTPKQIA